MWHGDRGLSRGGYTGAESKRDRSYLGKQMTEMGWSERALLHSRGKGECQGPQAEWRLSTASKWNVAGVALEGDEGSQGWPLRAPHQFFSLPTLEVSEEAEAILAKALQQHHAGRGFSVSGQRPECVVRAHVVVLATTALPRCSPALPMPVPSYSALSGGAPGHPTPTLRICPRGTGRHCYLGLVMD